MNTAEKLREASLEALRDLERSVKTSVTPERSEEVRIRWTKD